MLTSVGAALRHRWRWCRDPPGAGRRDRRCGRGHGRRERASLCRLAAWLILSAAPWCAVAPAVAQVNGAAGAAADSVAPDEFAELERGQEVRFEPAQFGVGDRVLARIVVRGAAQLSAPGTVAAGEWLSVHGVDVLPRTDGSWEVRVLFTSYRPGVGELPPIDVGPFRLTGIGFLTVSVLPRYGDVPPALRPPAAQMAVPGTAALLIGGALTVLVAPYLLVSGGLLLAGAGGRVRARRARTRPRLLLERGVQELQSAATAATAASGATAASATAATGASGATGASAATAASASASASASAAPPDAVAFYARLSHLARGYLAERLALPAHALTVRELRAALPEQGLPHGLGADLAAILDTADRVKFAGRGAGATEMRDAARQLVTLARAIDAILEERAARRRGGTDVEL